MKNFRNQSRYIHFEIQQQEFSNFLISVFASKIIFRVKFSRNNITRKMGLKIKR